MRRHKIGNSQLNPSDLNGLRWAWRTRSLVPFLGAGASIERGLPSWQTLVVELLVEDASKTRPFKKLPPDEQRALATWMAQRFAYDPLILSRAVKNADRRRLKRRKLSGERAFLEAVRRHLYAGLKPSRTPTTLDAIAELIDRGAHEGRIPAVVTFNFDDLLEQELARRKVHFHVVGSDRRAPRKGLPILHVHGFLPRRGPLPESPGLVFTEDDYHQLSSSVFHWALTELVGHLRHHTALFLGLSMSDRNLRRLLDAAYVRGDIPVHWQVQRRHQISEEERAALKHPAAVDAALKLADRYDRELLESMGVKTLWLEEFADLAPLLEAIPG
jgi:hypothetical protein